MCARQGGRAQSGQPKLVRDALGWIRRSLPGGCPGPCCRTLATSAAQCPCPAGGGHLSGKATGGRRDRATIFVGEIKSLPGHRVDCVLSHRSFVTV